MLLHLTSVCAAPCPEALCPIATPLGVVIWDLVELLRWQIPSWRHCDVEKASSSTVVTSMSVMVLASMTSRYRAMRYKYPPQVVDIVFIPNNNSLDHLTTSTPTLTKPNSNNMRFSTLAVSLLSGLSVFKGVVASPIAPAALAKRQTIDEVVNTLKSSVVSLLPSLL